MPPATQTPAGNLWESTQRETTALKALFFSQSDFSCNSLHALKIMLVLFFSVRSRFIKCLHGNTFLCSVKNKLFSGLFKLWGLIIYVYIHICIYAYVCVCGLFKWRFFILSVICHYTIHTYYMALCKDLTPFPSNLTEVYHTWVQLATPRPDCCHTCSQSSHHFNGTCLAEWRSRCESVIVWQRYWEQYEFGSNFILHTSSIPPFCSQLLRLEAAHEMLCLNQHAGDYYKHFDQFFFFPQPLLYYRVKVILNPHKKYV